MTPNFDIFAVIPEALCEDVTLRKVNQLTSATTDHAGIRAFPRAIVETVITPEGVQMVVERMTWHLRASDLASGVRPDRGDKLVSVSEVYSGTYSLVAANLESFGKRWRCESGQKLTSVA